MIFFFDYPTRLEITIILYFSFRCVYKLIESPLKSDAHCALIIRVVFSYSFRCPHSITLTTTAADTGSTNKHNPFKPIIRNGSSRTCSTFKRPTLPVSHYGFNIPPPSSSFRLRKNEVRILVGLNRDATFQAFAWNSGISELLTNFQAFDQCFKFKMNKKCTGFPLFAKSWKG